MKTKQQKWADQLLLPFKAEIRVFLSSCAVQSIFGSKNRSHHARHRCLIMCNVQSCYTTKPWVSFIIWSSIHGVLSNFTLHIWYHKSSNVAGELLSFRYIHWLMAEPRNHIYELIFTNPHHTAGSLLRHITTNKVKHVTSSDLFKYTTCTLHDYFERYFLGLNWLLLIIITIL